MTGLTAMTAEEIAEKLFAERRGLGWIARCPAHDDNNPSLAIGEGEDGRVLLKCHAGCEIERILDVLNLQTRDLFPPREGGSWSCPSDRATAQPTYSKAQLRSSVAPREGLSLAEYANAKKLPTEFLRSVGVTEMPYGGRNAVRISYVGDSGLEQAVRFRIALDGDRFRWRKGSKPHLYGLDQFKKGRKLGHIALVEGESDCHTLWFHDVPAVGLPGASGWNEHRDAKHFADIETIYVVVEPDAGGQAVREWLSRSSLRDRVKLVHLSAKDASALYLHSPDDFLRNWKQSCQNAKPWSSVEADARDRERETHWDQCSSLACSSDILFELDKALDDQGLAGERRGAKLLYLAMVSRRFDRPVSVAVKGPSSGGKSYLVQLILKLFPAEAYYCLTGMSERALVYSDEPLRHRFLVMYEASGISTDTATYFVRTLLSENCLKYETVEKTKDGIKARKIEREGPTGLITTTTQLGLHPENETRLVSITVTDTQEQTRAVFQSVAKGDSRPDFDFSRWHALQRWIDLNQSNVVIPYAGCLANLVLPVHTRLRRDFNMLLSLIRAHTLLHQASRQKDDTGNIIATLEDYERVHELFADLLAVGVNKTV